ncbi:MAG: fibrobacter succinogenes major paralogous domain-containing protein [Fibrobacter sp.]|nr:fibrobacter succinogenes major paralogous domain-containing protein [Fibrobacter sp.]
MLKRVTLHRIPPLCLVILSLSAIMLTGCKPEAPTPRPVVAKSSSSVQIQSSSSIEVLAADTAVVDTLVKDTVTQSSSSEVSSSSIEQSSSSEEAALSSSESEPIVDTVAAVMTDSAIQEVPIEDPPQEIPSDTIKDTVETATPPVDTSLCADAPATVLCDKRDGQLYRTIHIGSQVWMAQNLNYAVTNSWCYRNSLENCSNYGRLYQWAAAMNLEKTYSHASAGDLVEAKHQGICPEGWYIPSDKDMEVLVHYVQESNKAAGVPAEEVGTSLRKETGWEENDEEILGTNRYGFAAVPAGYRDANGSFAFLGEEADFWVAEEEPNGTQAPHWNLYYANQTFSGEYRNLKTFAFSVRCIKK